MRGAIPSLPQYPFIAWYSVQKKHRDKFTFIFTLRKENKKGRQAGGRSFIFIQKYRWTSQLKVQEQ
jgi:hypothetical protein